MRTSGDCVASCTGTKRWSALDNCCPRKKHARASSSSVSNEESIKSIAPEAERRRPLRWRVARATPRPPCVGARCDEFDARPTVRTALGRRKKHLTIDVRRRVSAAANVSSRSTRRAVGALRVDGALRFLSARSRAMAALPSGERFILLLERAFAIRNVAAPARMLRQNRRRRRMRSCRECTRRRTDGLANIHPRQASYFAQRAR